MFCRIKLKKDKKYNDLINGLFEQKINESLLIHVSIKILNDDNCYNEIKSCIAQNMEENSEKIINENSLCDKNLINLLKQLNNSNLYESWLSTICENIKTTNFYIINSIINESFKKIPEELWIDKISIEQQIEFVKCVIRQGSFSQSYSAGSVRNLISNFNYKNPMLMKNFLDSLLNNLIEPNFLKNYNVEIAKIINNYNEKDSYFEKLKNKNNKNFDSILKKIK